MVKSFSNFSEDKTFRKQCRCKDKTLSPMSRMDPFWVAVPVETICNSSDFLAWVLGASGLPHDSCCRLKSLEAMYSSRIFADSLGLRTGTLVLTSAAFAGCENVPICQAA